MPGLQFGMLIGKIGEDGEPFKIGSFYKAETVNKELYVAINDSYYSDNRGKYVITKSHHNISINALRTCQYELG